MKRESTQEINHLLSLMERMECHDMTADEVEEQLNPTEKQEEPEQPVRLQETKQCRKIT